MDTSKIIVTFFAMLFISCDDQLCEDMLHKLNSYEQIDKEILVDLRDIFTDPWDELYIFQGFNTSEDISDAIGFEYKGKGIYDPSRLILQISSGSILSENRTECLSINLDIVLKNGYYKKEKQNSVIIVSVLDQNDKKYLVKN